MGGVGVREHGECVEVRVEESIRVHFIVSVGVGVGFDNGGTGWIRGRVGGCGRA